MRILCFVDLRWLVLFISYFSCSGEKDEISNYRNEDWKEHEENFRKALDLVKYVSVGGEISMEDKIEMWDIGRRAD